MNFTTSTICLFLLLLTSSSVGATTVKGPYPDGVPGSGYGCDNPCDGGDVNYVMEAKLQSYTIKGSKDIEGLGDTGGNDVQMFTRTFVGDASQSSPFCMDGMFIKDC